MTMTMQDVKQGRAKGPGGPPRIFETPEQMQERIDDYFAQEGPKSVYGLSLHLGFNHYQKLLNYQVRDEFHDTVMRAKQRIMAYYDEIGHTSKGAGHFCDRMLTRMGHAAIEVQLDAHDVATLGDLAAKLGGADPSKVLPEPPAALPVESITRDAEPTQSMVGEDSHDDLTP